MQDIFIYISISLFAFTASILTFLSGFGLGTILLVVFGIFFPIEIAIATTAIVHFINACFKISITYRFVQWNTIFYFGFFAILGSVLGSLLLNDLSIQFVLYNYSLYDVEFEVYLLDFVLALIILVFSVWDHLELSISKKYNVYITGGLLTGFFGGLSGHQGSIRTMFLSKLGMTPLIFSATSAMLSFCVDFTRIGSYWQNINQERLPWNFILFGIFFAIVGSFIGKKFLQKTKIKSLTIFVRTLLMVFAITKLIGVL